MQIQKLQEPKLPVGGLDHNLKYVTVVQKSCIQILVLGYHNWHIYMIFQGRYVASRKEITQNTS